MCVFHIDALLAADALVKGGITAEQLVLLEFPTNVTKHVREAKFRKNVQEQIENILLAARKKKSKICVKSKMSCSGRMRGGRQRRR